MAQPFKTILIEDEKIARTRLKRLLKNHQQHISIIEECENGEEGLEKINKLKPDLVFLDIAMPGLNAFEMLRQVEHIPLIIFTTAFDQYAIKAFEENSVDYLLKPVEQERLDLTIQKLLRLEEFTQERSVGSLQELAEKLKPKRDISFIPVKIGNRAILIKLENIVAFEAKEKYVFLRDINSEEFLISHSLSRLEERLPEEFIRVHRSFIVYVNHIQEIKKEGNAGYFLVMNDKKHTRISCGSGYINNVKKLLDL